MYRNVIKYLYKEKSKEHIDSTLKKTYLYRKFKTDKLDFHLYKIIDYFLIYLILILLQKQILSNYITIRVNETKEQRILSDEFRGPSPSYILLNDLYIEYRSKIIQVDFNFSTIRLGWNNRINNFAYMFSNINDIIEVNITNLINNNTIFSSTFSNCINLKQINIEIEYKRDFAIKDMSKMFYNCQSLTSFSFNNLYLDFYGYNYYKHRCSYYSCPSDYHYNSYYDYYYYWDLDLNYKLYHSISMSQMFYNCTSLKFIYMDSNPRQNISDMNYMFYNCISLESINLEKFSTGNEHDIDLSHMFYNCYSLTSIQFNQYSFGVNNMKNMFYNCSSLTSINLDIFFTASSNNNFDLSYLFYNCHLLETISFNRNFIVSDMKNMFYECNSLTSIILNQFSTGSNYIDLSYMFYNCHSIKSITFNSNNFKVNNMFYMFYNCSNLENIINLQKFRTDSSSYNFNMSYLFYNCQSLKSASMENNHFPVSDTRKMFYNCSELTSFTFNPCRTNEKINMTKMFYNCKKLQNVTLKNGNGNINPYNMFSMFYNCNSLTSLDLNNFKTDNVKYMSYMFYNCTSLKTFDIKSTSFSNNNVKNMRGIFQNCHSITTLDLTNFYTPKVEIMWDMFNGCSNLKDLYIDNFRTSNVIDMQSMFSGCSSLTTLNLNNFNTKNVQYMNEMFKDCEKLEYLYLSQFTSDSLSSMYRMFYNCRSLKYLNIFNLVEDVQSITEMFKGTSDNFQLCIKEKENIPKIYNSIYDKIIRDCNSTCYGFGNERNFTNKNKSCCTLNEFEYKENCYINCPSKTIKIYSSKTCERFYCSKYYNYEQNGCTDNIPNGYYLNDTNEKTIDKCHEDCKTCDKGPNDDSTNCLSCNDTKPYLYLGNCYTDCHKGYFIDSNVYVMKQNVKNVL